MSIHRFNPYVDDLTGEFFTAINSIIDKYVGAPMTSITRNVIEQELRILVAHIEMSGLMAPRMKVVAAYDGDHGAGRMTIELLDNDMLPIRRREPGYVPQVV